LKIIYILSEELKKSKESALAVVEECDTPKGQLHYPQKQLPLENTRAYEHIMQR